MNRSRLIAGLLSALPVFLAARTGAPAYESLATARPLRAPSVPLPGYLRIGSGCSLWHSIHTGEWRNKASSADA